MARRGRLGLRLGLRSVEIARVCEDAGLAVAREVRFGQGLALIRECTELLRCHIRPDEILTVSWGRGDDVMSTINYKKECGSEMSR